MALLTRRFAFFAGWLGASSTCEEARSSFFVILGGTVVSPQLDPCVAASTRHRTEVHAATVVVVVEEMGVVEVVGRVFEDTGPNVVLVVDVWRSVVLVGLVIVEEVELEVGLVVVVVGHPGSRWPRPVVRHSDRTGTRPVRPRSGHCVASPREVFGAHRSRPGRQGRRAGSRRRAELAIAWFRSLAPGSVKGSHAVGLNVPGDVPARKTAWHGRLRSAPGRVGGEVVRGARKFRTGHRVWQLRCSTRRCPTAQGHTTPTVGQVPRLVLLICSFDNE